MQYIRIKTGATSTALPSISAATVTDIVVPVTRKPAWLGTRSAFAVAGVADALEHAVAPTPRPVAKADLASLFLGAMHCW